MRASVMAVTQMATAMVTKWGMTKKIGYIYFDDVGCRPWHGDVTSIGRLIVVKPGGTPSIAAEDIHFPNGLVLDKKEKTLYIVESFTKRLTAFDISSPGQLENRRVIFESDDPKADDDAVAPGELFLVSGLPTEVLGGSDYDRENDERRGDQPQVAHPATDLVFEQQAQHTDGNGAYDDEPAHAVVNIASRLIEQAGGKDCFK